MLAQLDDLCRPSQEMSERTQRMVAAHSSGGRYYSHMPSGDQSHHHRRIRHSRSNGKSFLQLRRVYGDARQRGFSRHRAFLAACLRLQFWKPRHLKNATRTT